MTQRPLFPALLAALLLAGGIQSAAAAGAKAREATCYVLVEEGSSAEGNALFLQKMGLSPQALGMVAPTRFSFVSGSSFESASGSFSYEASTPLLVDRKGRLALYSVDVKFSAGKLPKVYKTITVDVKMADLAASGDLVQPAAKAIELAAAKAGMKSGIAWVTSMKMPTKSAIKVKVSLAK
jgi:hypothetical protein